MDLTLRELKKQDTYLAMLTNENLIEKSNRFVIFLSFFPPMLNLFFLPFEKISKKLTRESLKLGRLTHYYFLMNHFEIILKARQNFLIDQREK